MAPQTLEHMSDRELLVQVATTVQAIQANGCSKYPEHVTSEATQREQIRTLRFDLNAVRQERKESRHSVLAVIGLIVASLAALSSVAAVVISLANARP